MIQIFLNVSAHFRHYLTRMRAFEEFADDQDRWRRDPLTHPEIAAMSLRELADLPLGRGPMPCMGEKCSE